MSAPSFFELGCAASSGFIAFSLCCTRGTRIAPCLSPLLDSLSTPIPVVSFHTRKHLPTKGKGNPYPYFGGTKYPPRMMHITHCGSIQQPLQCSHNHSIGERSPPIGWFSGDASRRRRRGYLENQAERRSVKRPVFQKTPLTSIYWEVRVKARLIGIVSSLVALFAVSGAPWRW
jgi:hypothetical protein